MQRTYTSNFRLFAIGRLKHTTDGPLGSGLAWSREAATAEVPLHSFLGEIRGITPLHLIKPSGGKLRRGTKRRVEDFKLVKVYAVEIAVR